MIDWLAGPSRLATLLLLAVLSGSAGAQSGPQVDPDPPGALGARVDAIFERMNTTTSPGCALAVIRDGRPVYMRGYGMANLDHGVIISPTTVFHVASVSKQFTAAAILLLVNEGKLSLDADVRTYVPELPDFGPRITIRHLVHHTSGLRDQWELLGLAGWRYSRDLITDEDVLQLMARQKDLNFAPGAEHLYCNTGYTLLATIVKRVSGQSFRDFTTARIFAPLGMTRTRFRDDFSEIVRHQAYGYAPARGTFRLSVTNFDTAGATSLLTTVEDLARWDRNFYDGRIGGPALLDQMHARGRLNGGEEIAYAFGLTHGTYRGLATVGHSGSDAGYRADFLRFPGERFSVVCLCNLSTSNPGELARRVADVYLADRLGPAVTPGADDRPVVTVAETDLARVAGLYWNRDSDTFRRFTARDGALRLGFGEAGAALRPVGARVFANRTSDFAFEPGTGGRMRVTETVRAGRGRPVVFEAVEEFAPSASEAAEYAGVYRSDEVEPVYRILAEDGRLELHRLKFPAQRLEPLVRDVFRTSSATLRFTRDERGRVNGCVWNAGRIRGFRLTRESSGERPAPGRVQPVRRGP